MTTEMRKENERIEMDLASGSAKPYGSSRSIVRRIATSLPLQPCPRVHFQLHPYGENAGVLRRQNCQVTSLADVGWIDQDDLDEEEEEEDDEEDYLGRPRSGIPPGFVFRAQRPHPGRRPLTRRRSLPSLHKGAPDPQGPSVVNDEAIQKIGALESELAKLRVQIAQIVLAQEKSTQPGTPMPPPAPSGNLPPPPPPPPPPLPPPPSGLQRTFSAIELIKERRGKKTDGQTILESRSAEVPNMLDILKDINKVKLRSVKSRSSEGDARLISSGPMDPAALIAEALKRKFAHRYRHDSGQEDKDDFHLPVPEVKPRTETPLFGQHMLKSTGKKNLL